MTAAIRLQTCTPYKAPNMYAIQGSKHERHLQNHILLVNAARFRDSYVCGLFSSSQGRTTIAACKPQGRLLRTKARRDLGSLCCSDEEFGKKLRNRVLERERINQAAAGLGEFQGLLLVMVTFCLVLRIGVTSQFSRPSVVRTYAWRPLNSRRNVCHRRFESSS